jgi:hypothetical protein
MNQWWFVDAAYGLTLGATAALTAWNWLAMRAAERDIK